LLEVPSGVGGVAGGKVEGAELVERPRLQLRLVAQSVGRSQRQLKRADEVEPTKQQCQQGGEIARQSQRILVPALAIEAANQGQKGVDLVRDRMRIT
jgi:hypothetical protein